MSGGKSPLGFPVDVLQPNRVITENDAAQYCGLSVVQFRRLRYQQIGPVWVRLGERRLGYRLRDLHAWLDSRSSSASTAA